MKKYELYTQSFLIIQIVRQYLGILFFFPIFSVLLFYFISLIFESLIIGISEKLEKIQNDHSKLILISEGKI